MIIYNSDNNSMSLYPGELTLMFYNIQRTTARFKSDYPLACMFDYIKTVLRLDVDHFQSKQVKAGVLFTIVYTSVEALFIFKLLYGEDESKFFGDVLQHHKDTQCDGYMI